MLKFFYTVILSFILVAFGQPAWVGAIGPLAFLGGYALFWLFLCSEPNKVRRFWYAAAWYTAVQAIHTSWMTAIQFQGLYILVIYAVVICVLGLQFGALSLLIPVSRPLSFMRLLAIASLWTLLEWGRLHVLCGWSWSPCGMALAGNIYSLQMASLWGVMGLSFWVMLVNLFAFRLIVQRKRKDLALWAGFAVFPFLFGLFHLHIHQTKMSLLQDPKKLQVALVQPGLIPSERVPLNERLHEFVPALEQWRRIVYYLTELNEKKFDLIVLPESAVPYCRDTPVYSFDDTCKLLGSLLGRESLATLPPLEMPYAAKRTNEEGIEWWAVTNAFLAQAIANHFQSEVVIGLIERDHKEKKTYQAAFHYLPNKIEARRYEKRVLVPLAEYIPFGWCKHLTEHYGISEFFTHGKEAKVFESKFPFSISICYEETFPEIIREGRAKGAELFVNVTNDNWCTPSRLPKQHFYHGRIRAVENGVPLLRACNTGVTAGIDSLGRTVRCMEEGERVKGAISFPIINYSHDTLYTFWGDAFIICISLVFLGVFIRFKGRFSW